MMATLTKMVEDWYSHNLGIYGSLTTTLKAMASNIEFTNNCIEDLRKEIEANKKEIEKLKQSDIYHDNP